MSAVRLLCIAIAVLIAPALIAQQLPSDAMSTCTVTPDEFKKWFGGSDVASAPDSLRLNTDENCNFYRWAEQMYLYLTSPSTSLFGTRRVFDSSGFYDVSPLQNDKRQFIPHTAGTPRLLGVRMAKPGPHGLHVIVDRAGRLFEIAPPRFSKNGKQLIQNEAGALVEISKATIANKRVVLYGKDGKVIARPKPILGADLKGARLAQAIDRGKLPAIFLDSSGNPLDVSPGQADNAVLLAQNASIIYYVTTVNDFYAYFLTGQKAGEIKATQFPTTQQSQENVVNFARSRSASIRTPRTLAIEMKTSWVETAAVADPDSYITMTATVPRWASSGSTLSPSGTRTAKLALVGIHIVGSTFGHPEMLWATFEHFGNTPDATYSYTSKTGTKTVKQSTAGKWLFSSTNSSGPFNLAHATYDSTAGTIEPANGFPISASNTLRQKPFGAASNKPPNAKASAESSNSDIIAINNSVIGQLSDGDVRKNYYLVGCTWTDGGASPNGPYPGGNEVGTSQLSNSTMETYQQGDDTTLAEASNCFACHTSNSTRVSHIYNDLQPLPPKP
jgi:hypothetical protein